METTLFNVNYQFMEQMKPTNENIDQYQHQYQHHHRNHHYHHNTNNSNNNNQYIVSDVHHHYQNMSNNQAKQHYMPPLPPTLSIDPKRNRLNHITNDVISTTANIMYFEAPPEDDEERKMRIEMINNHSSYCANTYYTNGDYMYADNEQCVDEEDFNHNQQYNMHQQPDDDANNFVVVSALVRYFVCYPLDDILFFIIDTVIVLS